MPQLEECMSILNDALESQRRVLKGTLLNDSALTALAYSNYVRNMTLMLERFDASIIRKAVRECIE